MHQGLFRDPEIGAYQNRFRECSSRSGRFMQRDPIGYVDAASLYEYLLSAPTYHCDPSGLQIIVDILEHLRDARTPPKPRPEPLPPPDPFWENVIKRIGEHLQTGEDLHKKYPSLSLWTRLHPLPPEYGGWTGDEKWGWWRQTLGGFHATGRVDWLLLWLRSPDLRDLVELRDRLRELLEKQGILPNGAGPMWPICCFAQRELCDVAGDAGGCTKECSDHYFNQCMGGGDDACHGAPPGSSPPPPTCPPACKCFTARFN
jgi:RHS repeat-associated protein